MNRETVEDVVKKLGDIGINFPITLYKGMSVENFLMVLVAVVGPIALLNPLGILPAIVGAVPGISMFVTNSYRKRKYRNALVIAKEAEELQSAVNRLESIAKKTFEPRENDAKNNLVRGRENLNEQIGLLIEEIERRRSKLDELLTDDEVAQEYEDVAKRSSVVDSVAKGERLTGKDESFIISLALLIGKIEKAKYKRNDLAQYIELAENPVGILTNKVNGFYASLSSASNIDFNVKKKEAEELQTLIKKYKDAKPREEHQPFFFDEVRVRTPLQELLIRFDEGGDIYNRLNPATVAQPEPVAEVPSPSAAAPAPAAQPPTAPPASVTPIPVVPVETAPSAPSIPTTSESAPLPDSTFYEFSESSPPPPPPPPKNSSPATKAKSSKPVAQEVDSEAKPASEGKLLRNMFSRTSKNQDEEITPKNIMQFIEKLKENQEALFSSMESVNIPGAEEISSKEVERTLSKEDVEAQFMLLDKLSLWLLSQKKKSIEQKFKDKLAKVLGELISRTEDFVAIAYDPYGGININKKYFKQLLEEYNELLNILKNGGSTSKEKSAPASKPAEIETSTQPAQGSAESASPAQAPAEPTSSMAETQLSIPRATIEMKRPELKAETQGEELRAVPDSVQQPDEEDEQIAEITNENFGTMMVSLNIKFLLKISDDPNSLISEADITWLNNGITKFILFFNSDKSKALSSLQIDFFWGIITNHIEILTNILGINTSPTDISQKIERLKRKYEDLKKIVESKTRVEAQISTEPAITSSSTTDTAFSVSRGTTEFEIPELNAENQEQELSENELLEILTSISDNQQALIQLLPVFSQDGKKTLTEDDKNKFTAQQKLITDLKRNLSKKTNLNQNILDYFLKQIEDLLRECKSVLVYLAFIENVHEDEKQPMRELETAYNELLQVLSSKISNLPSAQESTSESSMKTTQTGIPTQVLPVLPPTTSETSEKAAIIDEFFSRLTDAEPEEQTPHSAGGATSVPNPESPARGLEVLTEDNYRTLFDVDSNTGDFEKRGSNAMFNAVEEIVWPDSWTHAFFSKPLNMDKIIFPNVKKITITNLNGKNALLTYNGYFARMLPSLEEIEIQNSTTDDKLSGSGKTTGIQGLLSNLSYMPKFRTITISPSHPLYQDIDTELQDRKRWTRTADNISIVTT